MATATNRQIKGWRIAGWGLLAALLTLPALAMRFGAEGVNWTGADFAAAAVLLGLLGLGVEFAVRRPGGALGKLGMAVAASTAFLLVWVNLAVGIIGAETNDANFLFAGVLAIATGGAFLARFEPAGMVRAMLATAGAHATVGLIALIFRLGVGDPSWPWDVVGTTVMFDGLWLLSAWLFHRGAAR